MAAVGVVSFVAGRQASDTPRMDASDEPRMDASAESPDVSSDEGPVDASSFDPDRVAAEISTTTEDEGVAVSSEADLALERRDALGTAVLVPEGWTYAEEVPGGSSSFVTFSDPDSPSKLMISFNGCVGCIDEGMATVGEYNGVPYPEGSVPTDAFGVVKLSPVAVAYARPSSIPGYSIDGIVRVSLYDGSPESSTVTEITLPTSEHDTATAILNFR
jgi:hypothetical protein